MIFLTCSSYGLLASIPHRRWIAPLSNALSTACCPQSPTDTAQLHSPLDSREASCLREDIKSTKRLTPAPLLYPNMTKNRPWSWQVQLASITWSPPHTTIGWQLNTKLPVTKSDCLQSCLPTFSLLPPWFLDLAGSPPLDMLKQPWH